MAFSVTAAAAAAAVMYNVIEGSVANERWNTTAQAIKYMEIYTQNYCLVEDYYIIGPFGFLGIMRFPDSITNKLREN